MAIDRRIYKTKEALKAALVALLKEKDLNKITVKELCERANINRGTFYTHYQDQIDLYNSVLEEMYHNLEEYIRSLFKIDLYSRDGTVDFVTRVFKFCRANAEYVSIYLVPHRKALLCRKIADYAKKYNVYGITRSKETMDRLPDFVEDYFYEYLAFGVIGIIQRWLENGMVESDEEIAKTVCFLVSNSIAD